MFLLLYNFRLHEREKMVGVCEVWILIVQVEKIMQCLNLEALSMPSTREASTPTDTG